MINMHPNSTQFPQTSDLNTSTGQQHIHYNLLNFSNTGKTGLMPSKPINISNNNCNLNRNQSPSPSNECSAEEIYLKNFSKTISFRKKNSNQFSNPQKNHKRFSDSILTHLSQLSILNNLHTHFQQQQIQRANLNIQPDQNKNTIKHRRSFNIQKILSVSQRPSSIIECDTQKLFIIRHGERVDSTFGVNWVDQVFDKSTGLYRRINLNLPKKMVTRKDYKDFSFDPPLTELGLHQCKLVGEKLANQGIKISHVYSSPALRCIQTADKILEGLQMRDKISIRIEPCLFEFLKWYPVIPVKWPFLDIDELTKNNFNIDKSYKSFYPIESLRKDEDELMFYTRSHFITRSILKNHQINQGNILIIGHASTIEVCTRQLTGGQPRIHDLKYLVSQVPFLSMHCVAKQTDGTWKTIKSPVSPNKHTAIEPFDWRFFR